MNALDTNVLVRFLVQDSPSQSKAATDFILKHCTHDSPGFIHSIVLCELVWVLESAYGYKKSLIAQTLENILRTEQLVTEHPSLTWETLHIYIESKADFSDILLGKLNQQHGCIHTVTFDKHASTLKGFKAL